MDVKDKFLPKLLLGRQWQTTQCNPLIDSGRKNSLHTGCLVKRTAVANLIRRTFHSFACQGLGPREVLIKNQGHETGMFVLYRQGKINVCSLPWIDAEVSVEVLFKCYCRHDEKKCLYLSN